MARAATDARPRGRTATGDPDAERRIEADLAAIADAVRARFASRMSALLLVGGYARGEGSVVMHGSEPGPYNDYDLVLVTASGRASALLGEVSELAHALTREVGLEVDLWPVARASLATTPPTLFWLDVALGAVELLAGDASVLGELPALTPRDVPLVEAARLLSNRAVGLALSNLEAEDRDLRRARHGHKAILACGDALLLAADRYAPTVAEREGALTALTGAPAVSAPLARAYADAARFRARPDVWAPPNDEDFDAWYERIRDLVAGTHLAFEARRVGTPATPAGYAVSRAPLFRGAPDASRLPVAALRAAVRGHAPLFPFVGHPRERLARVAVALAYGHDALGCRATAARLLGLGSGPGASPTDAQLHVALRSLSGVAG